jgi:hypothetical protein
MMGKTTTPLSAGARRGKKTGVGKPPLSVLLNSLDEDMHNLYRVGAISRKTWQDYQDKTTGKPAHRKR